MSDWNEHKMHVTESLKQLHEKMDHNTSELQLIKTDLATHKVKSGFWGAFMGFLVAISTKFMGGQ